MDFGLHDGLSAFFAICFLSGFLLSLLSTILGSLGHGTHHIHLPQVHLPKAFHSLQAPQTGKGIPGGHGHAEGLPMVNFSSLTAFTMWLGGCGLILHGFLHLPLLLVLPLAVLGGLLGGALVYLFIQKVLLRAQWVLKPEDYRLPGTLARVQVAIGEGSTGEIMYKQGGARRVAWAVSSDGRPIERDTEVLIERAEAGLVYVMPAHQLLQPGAVPDANQAAPRERNREFS